MGMAKSVVKVSFALYLAEGVPPAYQGSFINDVTQIGGGELTLLWDYAGTLKARIYYSIYE